MLSLVASWSLRAVPVALTNDGAAGYADNEKCSPVSLTMKRPPSVMSEGELSQIH
jgi:hypothetical protein